MEQKSKPREVDQYLPLTDESSARILNDFEGFALSCIRRMRVQDEEDVLYRVFERALGGLKSFRGESKLKTWLYRIIWREGVRHLEKRGKISSHEMQMDESGFEHASDDNAEQILDRIDTAENVRRALDKLRVVDREVLSLRFFEDLKLSEVAERMEIPLATAKVKVHRALKRLKPLLEEINDE